MAATVTLPAPAEAATSNAYEAMPNFIGLGQYSVHAEMYRAQLYFKTTGPGANSTAWTRVVGEIPAVGTMIHPFSTVILEVTTTPVVSAVVHPAKKTVVVVHHVTKKPATKKIVVVVHHVTKKPATKKIVVVVHHVTKKPATKKIVVVVHHVTKKTAKKTVVVAVHRGTKKPVVKLESVTRQSMKKPTTPAKKKVTSRPAVTDFRVGVATWYSYIPGRCASWYLPMGTRINVEDLNTGKVISCVVTDREAARGNRVVDLSETQFSELAPLGVGVVPVRVTW